MKIKYAIEIDLTEDELNKFGEDGWDLISVVQVEDMRYFYFRQILNYN